MACGENPKRVYANRGPSTRMGNVAGYRTAWIQAEAYRRRWDAWLGGNRQGDAPTRDLGTETLAEVLRGNILVHNHCYRADEMAQMIDIAREFGYRIRSFHHGVEAYKVADLMARDSISGSLWSDWGGFKLEALDGVRRTPARHRAGARAIVHSDDRPGRSGCCRRREGVAPARAIGRLPETSDPLGDASTPRGRSGLQDRIGRWRSGRRPTSCCGAANPFSVYTRAEKVGSTARCSSTASDPASSGAPTSSSASCRPRSRRAR
jgi:hypothetical protein